MTGSSRPILGGPAIRGAQSTRPPTLHSIEQACRVAELLEAGYSNRRIGEQLGVSGPRVSQIRQKLPALEPYMSTPRPTERLRSHRDQLWSLRRQALALAASVRGDLRELEEELEAARVDRILGLR
jgi:predicted transcriptional regulator